MGNSIVSPREHAMNSYGKFLNELTDKYSHKVGENEQICQDIDRDFSCFLEDFVVNDTAFEDFARSEQIVCLATMLYLHCTTPYELANDPATLNTKQMRACKTAQVVATAFADGAPARNLVNGLIVSMFRATPDGFYQWDDRWEPCKESDIASFDFSEQFSFDRPIRTCGLDLELVTAAAAAVQEYCNELKEACMEFNRCDSELYREVVARLKEKTVTFDGPSTTVPCYSTVIDFEEGAMSSHTPNYLFVTRLSYDPVMNKDGSESEPTPRLAAYLNGLNCDHTKLATTIARCAVSNGRGLTVLSGPGNSGKTTLLRVIHAMFYPFVCTQSEYDALGTDRDRVRTCLIDDLSSLSEEMIADHPCDHLLVVRESSNLEGTFGGRTVTTLALTAPIKKELRVSDFHTKLSTRKQLGHLLGWCLPKQELNIRSKSSVLENFLNNVSGCGNPTCSNCGESDETKGHAMPPGLVEIMKRMGASVVGLRPETDKKESPESSDSEENDCPQEETGGSGSETSSSDEMPQMPPLSDD